MVAHRLTCVLFAAIPLLAQTPTTSQPPVQRTRSVWFVEGDHPIGAEVGFLVESIAWPKDQDKVFAAATAGTRIALGATVWAELQTFTELAFDTIKVPAGSHYAVLERGEKGWLLGLLDPEAVRKAQLAPGMAKDLPLTAAIPLRAGKGAKSPLRAEWKAGGGGQA